MKLLIWASLWIVLHTALSAQEQNNDPFSWLAGKWKGNSPDGIVYENWIKETGQSLSGEGFVIVNGDTVVRELLFIKPFGSFWTYVAAVNKQQPVLFTMIKLENGQVVFENKEHDFPQRITYKHTDENCCSVRVEGYVGKILNKDDYILERIP